jgi:hypothetical protein
MTTNKMDAKDLQSLRLILWAYNNGWQAAVEYLSSEAHKQQNFFKLKYKDLLDVKDVEEA